VEGPRRRLFGPFIASAGQPNNKQFHFIICKVFFVSILAMHLRKLTCGNDHALVSTIAVGLVEVKNETKRSLIAGKKQRIWVNSLMSMTEASIKLP